MRRLACLMVLAALASAPAGAQTGAAEAGPRGKACAECARDSSLRVMQIYRIRHRDNAERIARLTRELSVVKRSLGRELSEKERRRLEHRASMLESQIAEIGAGLGVGVAARAFEHVGPAVAEAERAMAAALAAAASEAAVAPAAPEAIRFPGWVGITLDAPSAVEVRRGDVYWRFFEHPEIVSVDPSSPADRAGIRRGDVLLAYNGRDVRREIAMNRLLQPGRIVRVRVRTQRGNDVRDVPVKVAPAPDHVLHEPTWDVQPLPNPRTPRAVGGRFKVIRPDAGAPAGAGGVGVAPAPFAFVRFAGIGGAHMETITRGLGEAIGVEHGVLVISVPPGGPAHESGLVDGDVILRARGRDVHSVEQLRQLMIGNTDRAVKLDVARKGKVRQVTLRW